MKRVARLARCQDEAGVNGGQEADYVADILATHLHEIQSISGVVYKNSWAATIQLPSIPFSHKVHT